MAFPICEEAGPLREWAPESRLLQQIPLKAQKGLFSYDLNLTCLDVVSEYIALGTNCGLVYWYCRGTGELQRLRFENSNTSVSCLKVVSTVDYMVAAGSQQGTITVFQIPKKPPDSIPDELKPKNKSVERFTIDGLHSSKITTIEWSQNGMKLFSGDKNGAVVLTEIDFYMHLSKSTELLNEQFEIVQLSYSQQILVVSTVYRSIICDGNDKWKVHQIGTKERKTLGKFGAAFCKFLHGSVVYASRPGHRLWLADKSGRVEQTLIFKPTAASTYPKIQLLNPFDKANVCNTNFGKLLQYKDDKLVAYNSEILYVLHLGAISIVSGLDCARKILDVAIHQDEIYILEGERSLLRIGQMPDRYSMSPYGSLFDRRSSFSFDELASKIKGTAVGSIKKITSDLVAPQDRSSPPTLADEAVELPPIVDLPAGSVPNVSTESRSSNVRKELFLTRPENDRSGVFEENGKSFSSEVVARPVRRRNPRRNRSFLTCQGQESESDTTSTASEDRMVWGTANDCSASEESRSAALSQSSFSILKDVGCLLPSTTGPSISEASRSEDEASRIPEDKSPESVDTCESVSERLVLTPEKFLEEQEKIFARFAERDVSAFDGFNSEKTDDMSVSFNATPSSSVSSKTSENLRFNGETSENASVVSEAKTDESFPCENFKNDLLPLPKNLCFYRSNDDFSGRDDFRDRKRESATESSASDESSVKSFDPTGKSKDVGVPENRSDYFREFKNREATSFEVQNKEMILSKLLGLDLSSLDAGPSLPQGEDDRGTEENADLPEKTTTAVESTAFPREMGSDVCECDFVDGARYSCDVSDRESFLPESERDFGGFGRESSSLYRVNKCESEKKDVTRDGEDKKLPSLDPLSYGPPSGSSIVSNSRPSLDYAPGIVYDLPRLQPEFEERSDRWLQYKCPEPVTCLSVCDTYVVCTNINDQVYFSELSGLGLSWTLLDYKASSVDVSDDAGIVWILYKKTLFGLIDPSRKGPFSDSKMEAASNVRSFALDKINREGWIVKSDGQMKCQRNLVRAPCGKTDDVSCRWLVTSVACRNGCVMAVTSDEGVICKRQGECCFKPVKTPCSVTASVALGPGSLAWIVDDRSNLFFSDDFLSEQPRWWQVLISDYIFQHSPSVFQSMHSKIRLNHLRANIQLKNTMVAADESSVWIFDKFSTVVHVNKSDFTGYIWSDLPLSLPSLKWETLCAEGVFEDKGHLWFLSANGDIFCTKPNAHYFQSVPSPCADRTICTASSTDTLWVLYSDGKIYSRLGLTEENLTGNSWRELDLPRTSDVRLSWLSCGCDVAWGCDAVGRAFVAVGSPHRISTDVFDAAWAEVEDKPKEGVRFEKIFAGPQIYMVWALDTKKNVYVREGIFPNFQIGTGWVYVAGIEAVHLTVSGTSVWALSVNGGVYRRHGISENNYIGDYWKRIPGNLRTLTSSFTDELWGIDREGTVLRLKQKTVFLSGKKDVRSRNDTRSSGEEGDWEVVE